MLLGPLGFAETGPCQVQIRPMPSLTDARAPRKPCPRGTASTTVIISQNSPSLVGKSEPPYSQDRALACTRRTLSMRSNRGRRVLQVDDLHRTRERLGRSRYSSLASHSRAAQPLALLLAPIAIACACGAAARIIYKKFFYELFYPLVIDVFITPETEVRSIRSSCIIFQKFEITPGKINS